MLSMKADANRKHTKLENKALILFALLLSYLVNFTAWLFADRLISCRRIINDAKDFSTHQWNFLASIALSLRIISRFKGFLRLINLEISIFLEQIFTSGIILNETAKTKSVKFIYCTLKVSCQQKQWRNYARVDDFLLFLGASYLPVRVIFWNCFLVIAKIDRCG